MSEIIAIYLVMLIFLEVFELFWQRGRSFQEYLKNLYYFYNKSVILFIILHPTFYFSLFAQISLQNYSLLATSLSLIKFFDLAFKLTIMDKLFHNKDLGLFKQAISENLPLSPILKSSGLILYPTLFFFAYSNLIS